MMGAGSNGNENDSNGDRVSCLVTGTTGARRVRGTFAVLTKSGTEHRSPSKHPDDANVN